MRYGILFALPILTLAGCVAPPSEPAARPAPELRPPPTAYVPPPAPAPLPTASDWNDWPFTPGDWRYQSQGGTTTASFAGVLSVRCDRSSRQVMLGGLASGPATIRTTSMTRSVTPATPDRVAMGSFVTFSANDPLLDAIEFSRGRFVIEQTGQPPLVVPPQAEIGRVIEDCRG